jgi:ATP-dependent protease HslVU (ClpYQ) peptidase subunit
MFPFKMGKVVVAADVSVTTTRTVHAEDASHAQTILNVANDNMHAICGRLAYKV